MKVISRNSYSDEFKRNAVQQSLDSPDTVKSVALSLGISPKLLSYWRSKLTSKKKASNPLKNKGPEKSLSQLEKENRELRKRLEETEMERDFLKKATTYFDSLKE